MKLDFLGKIRGINVLSLNLETNSIQTRFDEIGLYNCNPILFPLSYYGLLYRSVPFDRWEYIKENGIDVSPTDAVIYSDCLDKASEYGEWPKVVLGFDPNRLDKTYREVDSTISAYELDNLLETFPTPAKVGDGSKIWLSRLHSEDPRRTTFYEASYARWVPEDPWEALRLIILADVNERKWTL